MHQQTVKMDKFSERRMAVKLRRLLDELRLLTASFPDLRDAFDPDELPLAFILERDSTRMERSSGRTWVARPPLISGGRRATSRPASGRRRSTQLVDE